MLSHSILVIDDTPEELADLISPLILKVNVRIAQDGMTGCHLACLHQPSLILLDVHMPHVNGFSIARLLKNNPTTRRIPIIFITSATDDASRIEGLTVGAVDYICKPFNIQECLLRIKLHLEYHDSYCQAFNTDHDQCVTQKVETDSSDLALVNSCVSFLKTHIANPPQLKELANMFGTNEKKLTELFKEHYDSSVFAWIRQYRLTLSCELLKSKRLTIGQISDQLGYTSQAYFTKSFKESFGCTPTEYILKSEQ